MNTKRDIEYDFTFLYLMEKLLKQKIIQLGETEWSDRFFWCWCDGTKWFWLGTARIPPPMYMYRHWYRLHGIGGWMIWTRLVHLMPKKKKWLRHDMWQSVILTHWNPVDLTYWISRKYVKKSYRIWRVVIFQYCYFSYVIARKMCICVLCCLILYAGPMLSNERTVIIRLTN